jgi:hypothetical protein
MSNVTEQQYIEMANDAKERIEEKNREIKHLKRKNKVYSRSLKNLQEYIFKLKILLDYERLTLGKMIDHYHEDSLQKVNFCCVELDLLNDELNSDSEEEEVEDDDLSRHLIQILNFDSDVSD